MSWAGVEFYLFDCGFFVNRLVHNRVLDSFLGRSGLIGRLIELDGSFNESFALNRGNLPLQCRRLSASIRPSKTTGAIGLGAVYLVKSGDLRKLSGVVQQNLY